MYNSMGNFIPYSKESGLSMSRISTLFRAFHKGNSAVSDIGEELGITCGATNSMLERLVQLPLIQRSENLHVRRFKQIALTDKGRQVPQESIYSRQRWIGNLASELSESEKGQVITALKFPVVKANRLDPNPS